MSERSFESMPQVGLTWLRALIPRPGLRAGGTVPHIEARVASHRADPAWVASFRAVTESPAALPAAALQAMALPLHMAVLTAPEFPLPLLGAVHVRQRIDVVRALGADEAAEARCWVEGARQARRGVEVDLHTTWAVGGETVWHSVTTFLSRTGGDKSGPRAPAADDARPTPELTATWTLPEDLGRRFAKVAGDRNPIHLYWWTARLFGFKRPIIHGMWTLARCLAALEGRAPTAGVRIDCSFRKPLSLPGSAAFAAWSDGDVQRFVVRDPKGRDALIGSVSPLPRGA